MKVEEAVIQMPLPSSMSRQTTVLTAGTLKEEEMNRNGAFGV